MLYGVADRRLQVDLPMDGVVFSGAVRHSSITRPPRGWPGQNKGSSRQQQGGGYETDCFRALGVGALAGAVAVTAPVSGQSDGEAAPIYGIKLPQGYRDWRLIAVKQLTGKQLNGGGGDLKQLRAELGNDVAIKAFRDGTRPFPDGAIIAALHWNEDSSIQTTRPWPPVFPTPALNLPLPGPP